MLDVSKFTADQWRGLSFSAGQDAANALERKKHLSAWDVECCDVAAEKTNSMLVCHPAFQFLQGVV